MYQLLLLTVAFSTAAPGMFSAAGVAVGGRVQDPSGNGLARIVVTVQTAAGETRAQAVTDDNGAFLVRGLGHESFTISVVAPGYHEAEDVADLLAAGEDEQVSITITLIPNSCEKAAKPKPPVRQNIPGDAVTALRAATDESRLGTPAQAIEWYKQAILRYPKYFDAHFALAFEYQRLGRYDEAIAELEVARTIRPDDERVYLLFGEILMQLKKFAVAAAVFGEAARLEPGEPHFALLRARALTTQAGAIGVSAGKQAVSARDALLAQAEQELARAFTLSCGELAAVRIERARALEMRGQYGRAADELERYLQETAKPKATEAVREWMQRLRAKASASPVSPSP